MLRARHEDGNVAPSGSLETRLKAMTRGPLRSLRLRVSVSMVEPGFTTSGMCNPEAETIKAALALSEAEEETEE